MGRTSDTSANRRLLLASEVAVCVHCFREFPPTTIAEWIDNGETTAVCPHCAVDAVVGFDGPVDRAWLETAHCRAFG